MQTENGIVLTRPNLDFEILWGDCLFVQEARNLRACLKKVYSFFTSDLISIYRHHNLKFISPNMLSKTSWPNKLSLWSISQTFHLYSQSFVTIFIRPSPCHLHPKSYSYIQVHQFQEHHSFFLSYFDHWRLAGLYMWAFLLLYPRQFWHFHPLTIFLIWAWHSTLSLLSSPAYQGVNINSSLKRVYHNEKAVNRHYNPNWNYGKMRTLKWEFEVFTGGVNLTAVLKLRVALCRADGNLGYNQVISRTMASIKHFAYVETEIYLLYEFLQWDSYGKTWATSFQSCIFGYHGNTTGMWKLMQGN